MIIRLESLTFKRPIGQVFLERGLIDEEELRTALNLQADSREKLGKILVDLGYVSERDCLSVMSEYLSIQAMSASDYPPVPVIENALTFRFMNIKKSLSTIRKSVTTESISSLIVALEIS